MPTRVRNIVLLTSFFGLTWSLDSRQEKDTRGTLKSEVDRWLTKDNLVVLDSLNYIKGFRYELYCISRALSSPHCVVCTTIQIYILLVSIF